MIDLDDTQPLPMVQQFTGTLTGTHADCSIRPDSSGQVSAAVLALAMFKDQRDAWRSGLDSWLQSNYQRTDKRGRDRDRSIYSDGGIESLER
jgi:hypothetical protein